MRPSPDASCRLSRFSWLCAGAKRPSKSSASVRPWRRRSTSSTRPSTTPSQRRKRQIGQFMHDQVDALGLGTSWEQAGCPRSPSPRPRHRRGPCRTDGRRAGTGHILHFDFGVLQNSTRRSCGAWSTIRTSAGSVRRGAATPSTRWCRRHRPASMRSSPACPAWWTPSSCNHRRCGLSRLLLRHGAPDGAGMP